MVGSYKGSLTREQFLFHETRIVAGYISRGISYEKMVEEIKNTNSFQFPTERMISSICRGCYNRIAGLESSTLAEILANGPYETARQINLYAMMKQNLVVWDFMTTVIGEKYRMRDFEFSRKDLNIFFMQLQEQNDVVASWSETTISKIKSVLTHCLVECGFLQTQRSTLLNPVLIEPELEDEIRAKGDLAALPAFNCFR